MTKRNRRAQVTTAAAEPKRTSQDQKLRVTDFVAPACSVCEALRSGENYSRVVRTKRTTTVVTRYCKCAKCNNTFKVVEIVSTT